MKSVFAINKVLKYLYFSKGHVKALEMIIDMDNYVINNRDEDGNTPMHCGNLFSYKISSKNRQHVLKASNSLTRLKYKHFK